MSLIALEALTKYYGKERGIIDVSLAIEEGEIFGFIGPNGAGKSTMIRTLLGLIYPTSGSAKVFGKDCILDGAEIRQDIGYLPAEVFYYDNMRVSDLLKYSASFYKKDCSKNIAELSDRLALDLTRKIADLSYGNKKKVGIVQGLLHTPRLILLDEPTSGLDPLMQQIFFDIIKEENERGATVLFSSHILGEVQKMCTRVAIIKEGRIIQVSDIDALKNDNYKRFKIFSTQTIKTDDFKMSGVNDFEHIPSGVKFLYKGDLNQIVHKLGGFDITNLTVEEPTLEEIFMHYYQKEV